ncbi:unnamed protein product [Cylicostephanus goldi]|uniref:GST N-terminal domain-containing protein n=1 Tax=Cylicostephanus goldi TaxID=71465 RepID=A0A3P7N5Q0_CYLGO|nr:unnamed protein product [Cylicostephanus goldi]
MPFGQMPVLEVDGKKLAQSIAIVRFLARKFDVRLTQEEWPKHKAGGWFGYQKQISIYAAEMPFGQMPVLEVDGKKLAQSFAIVRFLARKFGYAGKTPFEEALVDSIADQWKDFMQEVQPAVKVALGFEQGDLVSC